MSNKRSQPMVLTVPGRDVAVNRDADVALFRDALDRIIMQRPGMTPVFEWHGGPGIGKTTLVKALLIPECVAKGVPWVLIDFLKSPIEEYVTDPTLLLEAILVELGKNAHVAIEDVDFRNRLADFRARARPAQVIRAYFEMSPDDRLYRRPEWLEALRDVAHKFVAAVAHLGQRNTNQLRPVVLFFDETEHSDFELADWVEEWVISPLSQFKQVVVVWTARRPWRWKRPEIRRRLESRALGVFDQEAVQKQFQSMGSSWDLASALFAKVHSVTGGHPFANAVVIGQVNAWTAGGEAVTPDVFSQREKELLTTIFERFIKDYAFKGLDDAARIACELMGLVRIFDTTMLRRVLQEHGGDLFRDWRQEDYGDLLLRLKKTQLLVWTKGYGLDPALRYLIHEYYAICQPHTYVAVNRIAFAVYEEWLTRPVDNRALFLLEALYHQACLRRAGESVDLGETLDRQLQEYHKRIRDEQALRQAIEKLADELEHDRELERIVGEELTRHLVEQVRCGLEQRD